MDLPIAIPKNPVAWLERELIVKDSFAALAPMSEGMMQSSVTVTGGDSENPEYIPSVLVD